MVGHHLFGPEFLITLWTAEELFLRVLVALHVQLKTHGVHETLFTHLTGNGFLRLVRPQMNDQAAGLRKLLLALVAFVRFLATVDPEVGVQTANVGKGLATNLRRRG